MAFTARCKQLLRRASHHLSRLHIRTKVLGLMLTVAFVSGLVVLLLARALFIRNAQAELRQHGLSIAQGVASVCTADALCPDRSGLNRLLQQLANRNPDLRYIFVTDQQGRIVDHIINPNLGHDPAEFFIPKPIPNNPGRFIGESGEHIWESQVAITNIEEGLVRVGMGEAQMQETMRLMTGNLVITLGIVVVGGVLAALALTWLLTRPILALASATERIGQGDFSTRVRYGAQDEIGALGQSFNRMAAQLALVETERDERERQRQFYLQRVIHAQEEERRRVARELHDETGQALTSLMVGLRNVEEAPTEAEMRQRLADLRCVLATTLTQVRQLAYELRPTILDDLGLVAALHRYAAQFGQRFGVSVEIQASGLNGQRLPPEVETTVYRVVQEALLNAARHAHCASISIILQARQNQLVAIVEDDGCGFDARQMFGAEDGKGRLGLYGMRERAELVGGQIEIESTPGHGCTIFLRVPWAQKMAGVHSPVAAQ